MGPAASGSVFPGIRSKRRSEVEDWRMVLSWILPHLDRLLNAPALPTSHTFLPGSLRFLMTAWMLPSELALPARDRRGPCSPAGVGSQKGEAGRQTHGEADSFLLFPLPSPTFPLLAHGPLLTSSSPPSSTSLPSSRVKALMFQTGTSGVGASGICGVGVSDSGSGSG